MAAFDEAVNKAISGNSRDNSLVDKLLGKKDIEEIKTIMMKPRMEREDVMRLTYLLTSSEMKLHNLSERERYVLLKYFVWLREFVRQFEYLFDYEDFFSPKTDKEGKTIKPEYELNPVSKKLLENTRRLLEHNVKFVTDLFLAISRSSMSLGAAGFKELLINKFEMFYDQKSTIATEGLKK